MSAYVLCYFTFRCLFSDFTSACLKYSFFYPTGASLGLSSFKVHIIHVGNMANKGTQALLISDVSIIREIVGDDVSISVSTTDVEGVRRLKLPLEAVTPPTVDIPYEKADFYARRFGFNRKSFRYKAVALISLFLMFIQLLLSVISVFLMKVGLKPVYRAGTLTSVKD